MSTHLIVVLAMIAFAANSLLCRMALGDEAIDAASFTTIRLVSGALTLLVLLWWTNNKAKKLTIKFDFFASTMLFVYAICFSFAYLELATGTGALILFGMVQLTMVFVGVLKGERPSFLSWLGMLVAFSGLVYLVLPGVTAPSWQGALLMAVSGIAWGVYSLRGKEAIDPVANTTWNFVGTIPLTLLCSLFFLSEVNLSLIGVLLAIASGALASAVGYVLWYRVLPVLTSSSAATVQLSVPLIAAFAGVLVLNELLDTRLIIAGITVLSGIALTIIAKNQLTKQ